MSDCATPTVSPSTRSSRPMSTASCPRPIGCGSIAHLRRCAPCRARLDAEQAVRELLRHEHAALCRERAPLRARARDVAAKALRPRRRRQCRRDRVAGGVFAAFRRRVSRRSRWRRRSSLPRASRSSISDGLVACACSPPNWPPITSSAALMNRVLGTGHQQDGAPSGRMPRRSSAGWSRRSPGRPDCRARRSRPASSSSDRRQCLYGQGTVAHIMYRDIRHQGEMVSVFMIPGQTRTDELVAALGHEAAVWSDGTTDLRAGGP